MRYPFLGYTIPYFENADGPRYCVYCDAYGLEMNINSEWPVDTVLFTTPDLVRIATEETDVTSMGTTYVGADRPPHGGDYASIVAAGGKWVILDSADELPDAERAGLKVVLRITDPKQLADLPGGDSELVIAFQADRTVTKNQAMAEHIRGLLAALLGRDCRIVVTGAVEPGTEVDHLHQPDIDGLLIEKTGFDRIVELLPKIAALS